MRVVVLGVLACAACAAPALPEDAGQDVPEVPIDVPADAPTRPGCGAVVLAPGVTCEPLGGALIAPRDVWETRAGAIVATEMGAGRIVRLEGDRWVTVAEGLSSPIGLRELGDGDLVVAEENARAIARIDPATGARTEIAGGLRSVTYLALDASGVAYVSSFATVGPDGTGIVWRIDPAIGDATPYATGLHVPEGLVVEADGALVVAEWQLPSSIERFAAGSSSTSVTIADGFTNVYGLASDGAGGWLVGDHAGRVVRVRAGGERSTLVDAIGRPGGIARAADGSVLVAEFVDFGQEGRVLRLTGVD